MRQCRSPRNPAGARSRWRASPPRQKFRSPSCMNHFVRKRRSWPRSAIASIARCLREPKWTPGSEPVHDRLLDVLMRRLEALAPHKDGIASILRDATCDPVAAICASPGMLRRMAWCLEAAGVSSAGGGGADPHQGAGGDLSVDRVGLAARRQPRSGPHASPSRQELAPRGTFGDGAVACSERPAPGGWRSCFLISQTGSRSRARTPPSGACSSRRSPPWPRITSRAMVRPSPVPPTSRLRALSSL